MADSNFGSVSLLLPGIGENNSTTINDYSIYNRTPSNSGGVKTATASNAYSSSLSFSGSNRLLFSISSEFGLGVGDFTLQFYIRFSSDPASSAVLFDFRSAASSTPWALSLKNTGTSTNILRMFYGTGTTFVEWDGVLAPNTDHHVALSGAADGSSLKAFVDGVQASVSDGALPNATLGSTNQLIIGSNVISGSAYTGTLWDIELTKGVARYTTGFTPPTQLCPAVTGVAKIGNSAAHEIQSYSVDYPSGLYLPTATPSADGSYEVFTVNTKQTVICHHEDPENTVTATPEAAIVEPGGAANFYGINEGANNVGGINSILLSTL